MIDLTKYTRWITASIMKRVDDSRQDVVLYVEGQTRETQRGPRWIEARIDGPFQRPCGSKDEFCFYVEVNILCSVQLDDKDIYHMQRLLGIGSQALNTNIIVKKYGETSEDYVGCLRLLGGLEGIEAHSFGQIEATNPLIQGCVEAHYEMYI